MLQGRWTAWRRCIKREVFTPKLSSYISERLRFRKKHRVRDNSQQRLRRRAEISRPRLMKIPRPRNQSAEQPAVIHKVMCDEVHDLALALDLAIYAQQA